LSPLPGVVITEFASQYPYYIEKYCNCSGSLRSYLSADEIKGGI
jgi:hypothetical protein